MTATLEPTTMTTTTDTAAVTPAQDFTRPLCNLLLAVQYTIKRPTARPTVRDAKVVVGKDEVEVKKADTTAPKWKADIHSIWKAIDQSSYLIKSVIEEYSVCDVFRGARMVPLAMQDEMQAKLDDAVARRVTLVQRYKEIYLTEICPGLQEHCNRINAPYAEVIKSIPVPEEAEAKFAVFIEIRPFVEPTSDDTRTKQMFEEMARDRLSGVINDIFGEVNAIAEQIAAGGLGGGHKNQGSIDAILNVLDRANRFQAFSSQEVLDRMYAAREELKKHDVQQINKSPTVRGAIADAFRPLAQAARELTEQSVGGRSARTLNL